MKKEPCKNCGCKDVGIEPHSFDDKGQANWNEYILYCHNCDWLEVKSK